MNVIFCLTEWYKMIGRKTPPSRQKMRTSSSSTTRNPTINDKRSSKSHPPIDRSRRCHHPALLINPVRFLKNTNSVTPPYPFQIPCDQFGGKRRTGDKWQVKEGGSLRTVKVVISKTLFHHFVDHLRNRRHPYFFRSKSILKLRPRRVALRRPSTTSFAISWLTSTKVCLGKIVIFPSEPSGTLHSR